MKIVLVLISTIAVSSSAILFPNEMDKYKVSIDRTYKLGRIKDDSIKGNFLKSSDNEEENLKLEPRNINKIEDFGDKYPFKISNGNKEATIKPLQKATTMNQEKAKPEKLRKTFNFYAKRIYKNRNNNQEINTSMENIKLMNSAIAPPAIFVKNTKYSTEEKQDRKEYIFMQNKNFDVNDSKSKRRKRSSNIIEEETLFTTVSALKYTGRDTRLTNDLYFKNINQ